MAPEWHYAGRSYLNNFLFLWDKMTHLADEGKSMNLVHMVFSKSFKTDFHSTFPGKNGCAWLGEAYCSLCEELAVWPSSSHTEQSSIQTVVSDQCCSPGFNTGASFI